MKYTILSILISILLCISATAQQKKAGKPNVIFIYADDLGRGMLSCYGQKLFKTPNIDRIANAGQRFTNVYGCAYCAPARASLLTGYNDVSPGKWVITGGNVYPELLTGKTSMGELQQKLDSVNDINLKGITYLPQVFKAAGYVTGEIGKLEYGFATSVMQMKQHGWDYYYGYLDHNMCHGFYPPFMFENGKMVNIPGNTLANSGTSKEPETPEAFKERWDRNGKAVYAEDLFVYKAESFIQENKDKPFFLYYPTTLPHGPVSIPAIHPAVAFNNNLTSIEKEYASMVLKLDESVGKILDELERLNLLDNTIVIFSADNGHEIYYAQKGRIEKPYKNMQTNELFDDVATKWYSELGGDVFNGNDSMAGLKRSNWDGGAKVPLLMMWGSRLKKGQPDNTLISNYDFLTTMADLLHVKVSDKKDGISYLPLLQNKPLTNGHGFVSVGSHIGPQIITNDGWKLRYNAPKKVYQLYYLKNDTREAHNLVDREPQRAEQLKKTLIEQCGGDINNGWYRGY